MLPLVKCFVLLMCTKFIKKWHRQEPTKGEENSLVFSKPYILSKPLSISMSSDQCYLWVDSSAEKEIKIRGKIVAFRYELGSVQSKWQHFGFPWVFVFTGLDYWTGLYWTDL